MAREKDHDILRIPSPEERAANAQRKSREDFREYERASDRNILASSPARRIKDRTLLLASILTDLEHFRKEWKANKETFDPLISEQLREMHAMLDKTLALIGFTKFDRGDMARALDKVIEGLKCELRGEERLWHVNKHPHARTHRPDLETVGEHFDHFRLALSFVCGDPLMAKYLEDAAINIDLAERYTAKLHSPQSPGDGGKGRR